MIITLDGVSLIFFLSNLWYYFHKCVFQNSLIIVQIEISIKLEVGNLGTHCWHFSVNWLVEPMCLIDWLTFQVIMPWLFDDPTQHLVHSAQASSVRNQIKRIVPKINSFHCHTALNIVSYHTLFIYLLYCVDLKQEIHVIIQSKHSCLLDFSLRIWQLKYIKQQYCQLCYMVVKHGLLH